jgi:hypothetical protein
MRSIVLLVSISAVSLTLACKAPESGETMTLGTAGDSSTTAPNLTLSPTTDAPTTTTTTGTTAEPTTAESPSTTAVDPSTTSTSTTDGAACVPLTCAGKLYACGDCIDNDGDGKVDLADPECVSPCDDREDTFATGLPGDNMDPCNQDCFFDGNSGAGDDKCNWNLKCDPKNPGGDICPYDPNYKNCPDTQPQQCLDTCKVPNGCDCFGCCTVEVDGMTYDIFLGDPDCALSDIDSCTQCTKNEDCDDACDPDKCEICFGETEPPPGCEEPTCETGEACTIDKQGNSTCPEGYYCQTGCCWPIIPG